MLAIWPIATSTPFLEKLMTKCFRLTFALAMLCAAFSTAMAASENATLYLFHGIPGLDYSTSTDPAFPVDVLFNDEVCAEHGIPFGAMPNPLTFIPGSYDVKISPANTLAPCSNSPLLDTTITVDSGKDYSAVLALSTTGTPTLLTFTNSFSAVTAGMGRVMFGLAADSSAVTLVLQNTTTQKSYTYTVNPGAGLNVSLPADSYTVTVSQGATTLVSGTTVDLYAQSVTLMYAVGEASNNTVTLETKTVRDVI